MKQLIRKVLLALGCSLILLNVASSDYLASGTEITAEKVNRIPIEIMEPDPVSGISYYSVQNDGLSTSFVRDSYSEDFADVVRTGIRNFQTSMNISAYKMTVEEMKDNYFRVLYNSGDLYYVKTGFRYSVSGGYVRDVYPVYIHTKEEVQSMNAAFSREVEKVRGLVKPWMSDLEIALIVNDYLATNISYAMEALQSPDHEYHVYTAYGALVEKSAVCQGYSLAYNYLLREVFGVPAEYVVSESMNHAWNMVQIDGEYYHVDVTWNDPVADRLGYARHMFFLLSDAEILTRQHEGWYSPVKATSTKYDHYSWEFFNEPFARIADQYYFMGSDRVLYKYSAQNDVKTPIANLYDLTRANGASMPQFSGASRSIYALGGRLYFLIEGGIASVMPNGTLFRKEVSFPAAHTKIWGFLKEEASFSYVLYEEEQIRRISVPAIRKVTGVSVQEDRITLMPKESKKLSVSVSPYDASNKQLTYISTNPQVVEVRDGMLYGGSVGSAEVYAVSNDGDFFDKVQVTVQTKLIKMEVLKLPDKMSYTLGQPLQMEGLSVRGTFEDGSTRIFQSNELTYSGFQSSIPNAAQPIQISSGGVSISITVEIKNIPTVSYRTHVQNYGWQGFKENGQMSGTTGESLRLEGIEIMLRGKEKLGVKYTTHVQNLGWQDYVADGVMSGTSGKSLRLEAIKLELTGENAALYDIYYRVHAENMGWMGWARNGEPAGTSGCAYRLEGIEILVVQKGMDPPYGASPAYASKKNEWKVTYQTHVQNQGWQSSVFDGAMSGTSGQSLRLEAITISLGEQLPEGSIEYTTHVQNKGWLDPVKDGALSGTSGQGLRLEAIRIRLTGEVSESYDIYYRVHAQNIGWMGWAKNGEDSGTAGYAYRLEGIEIQVVPKGAPAPGSTAGAFRVRG
ncbi:Ig-like domain-containing protein [Proteiniclasticum ruminis]|uniref:Transglutaminase-like superfamily protein n=1 Tax=Proteiniclasticum ruminis TaxID=398199 RepID=A0A1I5A6S8_9CLOT|nr:Ig-like domain-containing protein [Proteiniclasticum ruminis]SFN57899.1 Transglutaminase-like superfamily protein [Proteiniclasticum ruminis]